MKQILWLVFGIFILLTSCAAESTDDLASFEVFCEMVSSGVKPIALSHPMEVAKADELWDAFKQIANKHQVQLYREEDFPKTALFPASLTEGKTVILIYTGNRLTQYEQLKADLGQAATSDRQTTETQVTVPQNSVALARRFGRLLGYTTEGSNRRLSKTSGYQTLASFGITGQITHLYYENVQEAQTFYTSTLRLQSEDSVRFQISQDAFIEVHPLSELHPKGQPKSTAIALLTDQLPQWYALMQEREVPIKYTYKPKTGGAHDGFVAVDPGGYLLEFEQFKQHPENEAFMAALANAPKVPTGAGNLNFFGSITWTYHKDMLKMQQFYEEVLGFSLVADQGWTKIYQTAPNSYIGLVDQCRGMEDYAETKAVELQWNISDSQTLNTYAEKNWLPYNYKDYAFKGPEHYRYVLKPAP